MPITTDPAAAPGLPGPNRRGFLRGLGAASAAPVLTLPAAADAHLDAELVNLWRRREGAAVAEAAAADRLEAIETANPYPDLPAAVFVREGDDALKLATYAEEHDSGHSFYPFEDANGQTLRWRRAHWRWQERPVNQEDWPTLGDEVIVRRVPWPEAQARADEIAAAWDHHRECIDVICRASGVLSAEEEWGALADALSEIDDAIVATPARTIDGLGIKARLAKVLLVKGRLLWPALSDSLVRDLVALTEGGR